MKVLKTDEFSGWLRRLRDLNARLRIDRYFQRIQDGAPISGDYKSVGGKVIEVRFHYGPGYRVYLTQTGCEIVLLLVGGDKSTQVSDIAKAKALAEEWRRSHER